MKIIKLTILLSVFFFELESKIRILTFHYNRPDFIAIQYKTFKKFLRDDHEIIVFNDAPTIDLERGIQEECDKYGIKCVRFEQHWHEKTFLTDEIDKWATMPGLTGVRELATLKGRHPSVRHCHVIQYALDNYGYDHDDVVGIVDGDMFPIRSVSIKEYLKNYEIVSMTNWDETRSVEFLWVGLCFFDVPRLPNIRTLKFHLSRIKNRVTDSGGHSYYYLQENPNIRYKKFKKTDAASYANMSINDLKRQGFNDKEITFLKRNIYNIEFHGDQKFLHYSRSSFVNILNPYAPETDVFHQGKSNVLNDFVENILID